ncbi:MAG: hypothetical protein Ta2B_28420 [Termitinemataceae bacterium]|nr:MAG: hypothetical protein Ta2B_28420 [Termitinemataceae bacterium]
MKTFKYFFIFLFLLLTVVSCNQDPIFFNISLEVEPVDPKIQGSISKMVKTSGGGASYKIYTANGSLWCFSGNSWNRISAPGRVFDVAITANDAIFILCIDDLYGTVYKQSGGNWVEIKNNSSYSLIQSIFAADNRLFAGACKSESDELAILELKPSDTFGQIRTDCRDLTGVAYYPLTAGDGIYYFSLTNGIYSAIDTGGVLGSVNPLTLSYIVKGIFSYEHSSTGPVSIIAVTNNANIISITVDDTDPANPKSSYNVYSKKYPFTGAIASWKSNTSSEERILFGVRGGIDNYGYYEMKILGTGKPDFNTFYEPGELKPDSSVDNIESYRQQLKKHLVNSLMQAPSSAGKTTVGQLPVVFAGTQKDGVWSYRETNEKPEGVWNAEE